MRWAEPFLLLVIFSAFIALYGSATWTVGGLYLDTHEGDSYHLLDILTRMSRGDVPHLDFMTPLGALAFWPIHWFIGVGYSAGAAFTLAQLACAAALLPFVLYATATRLNRGLGIYFGLVTLGLVLALSYGTATSGVGISMHYNRWAWALAFVVLVVALIPATVKRRPRIDGLVVGVLLAGLLLLKITYFVVLAPIAALALWQMHRVQGLAFAVLGGMACAVAVTVYAGMPFWFAYINDLRAVVGNSVRPYVGASFDQIVAGPRFIAATLIGLMTALLYRKVHEGPIGLGALLLIPGFLYITYQNFGNDPQWLLIVPVLVLALPGLDEGLEVFGQDVRRVATLTAFAAGMIVFPSFFNIALSPIKHMSLEHARFIPMLPEAAGHQDVFVRKDRAQMMTAQVFKDQELGPWAHLADDVSRPPVQEYLGATFPNCEFMAGSRAIFETLGDDLAKAGLPSGSRLFTADLLSAYWFFAPVVPPQQGAPWYYGNLAGVQNADYVMVPKCPFTQHVRNLVLNELRASEVPLTLVRDNDLLALYRVNR